MSEERPHYRLDNRSGDYVLSNSIANIEMCDCGKALLVTVVDARTGRHRVEPIMLDAKRKPA